MQIQIPGSGSGEPFRVVALLSAFNEGDVISAVIQHLVEQGVDVYLLDNRSTDDTVEQASRWLGRGLLAVETFPAAGDERYEGAAERFDWTAILLRKEELAQTLEADWFIHHDADEIREAPWGGVTLKDAIRFVDRLDYNCIDFRVYEFPPIDDGFRQGMDPRTYFRYYQPAKAFDQLQVKCWKSQPAPVSLVHAGGHDVAFDGKRPFPIPFLLRHYPIRGQCHGMRKVFHDRKDRFSPRERAKSWHVQYDHIEDDQHSFVKDPETLRPFDIARAQLEALLLQTEDGGRQRGAAAALEARVAALQQELASASASHQTLVEGLQTRLAAVEGELESARQAEQAERLAVEQLEGAMREVWQRADDAGARVKELEVQLAHSASEARRAQEELRAVYSSRTWQWGEPIGRLIQSLGIMRGKPR